MNPLQATLRILAVAAAVAALPAHAQTSDLLQSAWERISGMQAGKSPKSTPVASDGAIEQWGEAMPFRGTADDAQRRSIERLQKREGGTAPRTTQPRREQTADERPLDDRQRDDRLADPRKRQVQPDERASRIAEPATRQRRSAEDRYYGQRQDDAPATPGRASACSNVARAWEGAAALADRGDEQRAYDAYLRLLSSCNNEKELIGTVFQAQKNLGADAIAQLMQEPVMESPKLAPALYTLKLQRMYLANKARDAKLALSVAREIRPQVLESGDAGALEVSGWLEQRARSPKTAEPLFRAALRANRDAEGARQGLVFALLAQGKVDAASREADRLDGASGEEIRAEVLLAQARASLKAEQYADALKKVEQAERMGLEIDDGVIETKAWALKGSGQADKAAKLFLPLAQDNPENKDLQVGLVDSLYAAHDDDTLQRLSAQSGSLGRAASDAVARRLEGQGRRVEAARLRGEPVEGENGGLTGTVGVRSKSGEAGAGRLTEKSFPGVGGEVRINDSTTVSVKGMKLDMDDGVHTARGGEVRVQAKTRVDDVDLTLGAGASKTGGSTKPTFEAKARTYVSGGYIEAGVSREPVRDSVRSYSGINIDVPVATVPTPTNPTDPVQIAGTKSIRVGRVFDTNAYIAGSTVLDELNRYNLAWSVGGGSIQGTNSYNNGYYRVSAAVTKELQNDRFSWLNVGPYFQLSSYERDENRFDGAYGGYFSPKSDVGVGLLANAMTREGGTSLYKASAQMGYVSRGLYYGNDSGIAVEGGAEAAWLLSPHVILGAGVSLRTSPGYSDVAFRFGLVIPFERRGKLTGADLPTFKAAQ